MVGGGQPHVCRLFLVPNAVLQCFEPPDCVLQSVTSDLACIPSCNYDERAREPLIASKVSSGSDVGVGITLNSVYKGEVI